MIEVKNLRKEFKAYSSRQGLLGAFRDLFTRNYTNFAAVDNISFTVKKGEMVGYIGENGAGKSTTIKMLTGILTPTNGELLINGMNPHKEREQFVRSIGVVFGQRSQLWWDIAVQESFRLLKKVYRVPDEQFEPHMKEIIERLDIGELLDKPVRKLSLGQRMRCELAAALIHNPPLLFLDEPTIGLDVLVKLNIREFLKDLNEKYGTTILLTTHDLTDIEALCERVILLDKGKVIYDDRLDLLHQQLVKGKQIQFQFAKLVRAEDFKSLALDDVVTWKQGENEQTWTAHVASEQDVSRVIQTVAAKMAIMDMKMEQMATEEIIRNIYEKGMIEVKTS